MLSFITPAHNEERWIGHCLRSVREATEKVDEPYEVIVVGDASTDSTARIAQQTFDDWQQNTNDLQLPQVFGLNEIHRMFANSATLKLH